MSGTDPTGYECEGKQPATGSHVCGSTLKDSASPGSTSGSPAVPGLNPAIQKQSGAETQGAATKQGPTADKNNPAATGQTNAAPDGDPARTKWGSAIDAARSVLKKQFDEIRSRLDDIARIVSAPKEGKTLTDAAGDALKLGAAVIGLDTAMRRLGPNDEPQRYVGPWTERDLKRATDGKGPLDFNDAENERGQRMQSASWRPNAGSGIHEATGPEHSAPGIHQNRANQPRGKRRDETGRQTTTLAVCADKKWVILHLSEIDS